MNPNSKIQTLKSYRPDSYRRDLVAIAALFALALLWFVPVLFPGLTQQTLLPYDNLYGFAPFRTLQPGLLPHNNLLSDLVLENAVWKLHIQRTLAQGQLPLWNPQIFTGIPFLAAGQASVFYPLSILFYILPLEAAYGWFTALQIGLAGANLYVLGRVLRLRPVAAFVSSVIFMFSGFLMVSVVFTMFLAGAVWLPLLLAVIELIIRKQEEKGIASFQPIPYIIAGALIIGLVILAGHPELIYYTLLVAGAYTAVRLGMAYRIMRNAECGMRNEAPSPFRIPHSVFRTLKLAGWLLLMAVLGVTLGGIQLLPLIELLPLNFRQGSVSYDQVVGWAWPKRHIFSFFLPNIWGNPSHHQWFDLWSRQWQAAPLNNQTIDWGVKNYVEGGNYLGIATWLLAALGIRSAKYGVRNGDGALFRIPHSAFRTAPFWAVLAIVSLLFAFGTPLYRLLFYGLPGWNQLHSPFRWVFPFTLSMALLAGMGLQALLEGAARRLARLIAICAMLAGVAGLAMIGLSLILPAPFVALAQRVLSGSDLAQTAFSDGRMFWSYQAANLLHFALVSLGSGLLINWLSRARQEKSPSPHLLISPPPHLLILLIALDLYAAHGRFNPSASPALSPLAAENVPPVVQFINAREGGDNCQLSLVNCQLSPPWRFTTFNLPTDQTFWANVGMYYGWQDLRGYDSIIPRQYVQLIERIQPQANALLYNRIAPLQPNNEGETYAALDNPLLDLLNVKYILSEHVIPNPSWQEIYRDDALGVYENKEVFPRALIVPAAQVAPANEQPLLTTDLRQVLYVEEPPVEEHALSVASPLTKTAQISRYTANEVFVDVNLSDRGWLLLTDAFFPGWKAYLRPFGGEEGAEEELTIYRADGALRAVYLPSNGQWTVRFVYTPMSVKLGLYSSFMAGMAALFLMLYWLWGRYYRPEQVDGEARTVAKNSLVPMALNLTNKLVDFAYAMLYVRLLGPAGTGQYYFVVAVYGVFEIVSRYGLGTLLTRDVSADKHQSSRYLTNVLALRTLLWLVSLPVLGLVVYGYSSLGQISLGNWFTLTLQNIGRQEVQAIGILALSMLFANWADGLSSMFQAFEKMEYPAGLASASGMVKVTAGALVLLLGYGYVGLAWVSLLVNVLSVLWLWGLLRRTLFQPQWQWDWPLQRLMLQAGGPLMINHLLATIFWRIDVWILRPLAGEGSVGLYSVGLKYLDGLNIIPSVFTMALFPLMSRLARQEGNSLLRAYVLSLRLLVMICLPIAMAVTFLAGPLVYLVGGAKYLNVPETFRIFGYEWHALGGSDLALRVIIWSIPIGFVNSVTQYVLIAVNQQRYLTRAFILGVIFNTVGNLLVVPGLGYVGSALVTILSEFSLLFPFYYSVRRNVGVVPWLAIFLPPAAAVAVMGAALYMLTRVGVNLWLATALSCVIYASMLLVTGALRGEEMAVVARALPLGPLRRWLPVSR